MEKFRQPADEMDMFFYLGGVEATHLVPGVEAMHPHYYAYIWIEKII